MQFKKSSATKDRTCNSSPDVMVEPVFRSTSRQAVLQSPHRQRTSGEQAEERHSGVLLP